MSYTYTGTKITGVYDTAYTYKNSGISKAVTGQTYFNTNTGHVYTCTQGGKASEAKWKYTRTDINAKPTMAVSKLATPTRSGNKLTGTWTVPTELTNEKSGSRAQSIKVRWILSRSNGKKTVKRSGGTEYITSTIELTRSSYYPQTKHKLWSAAIKVITNNSKGDGKSVSKTLTFKRPKKPTLSSFNFNTENGDLSITITSENVSEGKQERYDTKYKTEVYNSATGEKWRPDSCNGSSTSTSKTISYDAGWYQGMKYKDYIRVKVSAYARGLRGDSDTVSKTYYIAYPARVEITKISISSKKSDGKFTAKIKTNSSKSHPVDRVRLEYLANVQYANADSIPGDASWQSTDITDDNRCTALSMPVGELIPDPGKHTWVRVKSWHANEAVLYRYSKPMEVKSLFVEEPTAADDDIAIISATPGSDGKSIVVQLGWNADGTDDSTGTELTWSEEEDAWRSTAQPDAYTFTWSDGTPVTHGGITYQDSALVTIKNLEEGTRYHIKARRYLEGEERTTYSEYSNPAEATTNETPESIVASCDRYVPEGDSLPVYWTFSGNGIQTEWQIMPVTVSYEATTDTQVIGTQTYYEYDETTQTYALILPEGTENPSEEGWYIANETETGAPIAEGRGSIGAAQISAERLASFAVNNELTFIVRVSTGGDPVESEAHTVTIINPPVLSVNVSSPLTHNSMSFTAICSRICDLRVIITSLGAAGQFPEGILQQVDGDTIHSGVYSPEWTEVQGEGYSATVEMPEGLDFWDLGKYALSVVAIDRDTGLQSAEEDPLVFDIAWENKAADPNGYVTLTPVDIAEENGIHHQAVEIALTPPEDSAETDVYDIYRLTGDGAYLIGEGFPLTYTAVDEYAPFGDDMTHHYRVAIRTVDGDVEFSDLEYELGCAFMRFDWATGSLELPYNLSIGDKYKKDVEIRTHMDGSMDGYWNQNIERTASLSSDVIRLAMPEEIDAARKLARYTGPVFVRTPDGSAYEADVQVSDMSTEGIMTAIAIDATEIGLTQEFILPTPFTFEEPDESGESGESGGSGGE